MRKCTLAVLAVLATLALCPAAIAVSAGDGKMASARAAAWTLRADASCHDPCDDPFRLKAWVRRASDGAGIHGVKVTFRFTLASGQVVGTARTDAMGYAHFHKRLTSATAPGGVRVKVVVTATYNGVTKSATTWFTPNYS
jgi:hypothetical protein